MTDKPYTDADVELVAATFTAEAKKNPIDRSTPPWMPQTRMLLGPTEHDIARAVLDALAAAGWHYHAEDDLVGCAVCGDQPRPGHYCPDCGRQA